MRKRSYIDYQERAKDFSVGDIVVPVGLGYTYAGRVTAVWPAIGAVDVEFPELNKRMVVEELIRLVDFNPTLPPTDNAPAGSESVPVSDGPLKSRKREAARLREAVYWASKDRQYRATRQEADAGSYFCPKCKETQLRTTIYKRERGQSDRLLGCPSCLWLIKETDLMGCTPINKERNPRRNPRGRSQLLETVSKREARQALRRLYRRWEKEPARVLTAEVERIKREKPEVYADLLNRARS